MGNPSKSFELIRLYPKLSADPANGKVGEIYYNSTNETLRICINEVGPIWANVIVSFAGLNAGTENYSTLRWDSASLKWIENDHIYLENNSIHGKNNSDPDAIAAQSLTIQASNKTAGTGDGGDLILNAGTSVAGSRGALEINSSSILINGASLIYAAADAAVDAYSAQSLTIQASNKTAGTGNGGDLILNAGTSVAGSKGAIVLNGHLLEIQAALSSDPLTGTAGQLYFNTTNSAFKFHNGTEWLGIGDLLSDGSVPMNGDLNLDSHKITNLLDPTDLQDAATKKYVDDKTDATLEAANVYTDGLLDVEITERLYQENLLFAEDLTFLKLNGSRPMTGALNLASHKITNLANGTDPSDAINLSQLTAISEVTNEPTGFENRNHSELLFNDNSGSPIFTIQPKAPYTFFDFYVRGIKYTKSVAQTVTTASHPSFPYAGNNYFYFDENGILQVTDVFDPAIIKEYAFVAIAYWNPETNSHTYFAEERHGLTMDGETHSYLHTVFGARYLSGLALDTFNTSTGYFEIDQGSIRDEDILHLISRDATVAILYRQGVNSYWRKKAGGAYPLIYPGSLIGYAGTTIPYNEYTGVTWQLTAVQNNKYVLMHYFATNDIENPIIGIQGIAQHDSVEAARTAANEEISSLSGLPFAEFVPVGTVIFQTNSGYVSPTKGIIQLVDSGNYVDFRGTQLYTPAGTATTHSLLSGLSNDDHFQYLLVGGTRAMSGNLDMGTHKIINVTDPTLAQDAATKNYVDSSVSGSVSDTAYSVAWNGITGTAPSKNAVYDELETLLKKDGTRALTGNLNLNSNKIINVTDPTLAQDAATKNYVDTHTELVNDLTPQLGGNLDVQAYSIFTSVVNGDITITPNGIGSIVLDGLNWPQTDGTPGQAIITDGLGNLSWGVTSTGDFLADGSVPMTGNLNLDSHKIINVLDPTDDQDAATKIYVDLAVASATPDLTSVVLRDGSQAMTGDLDLDSHKIVNVTDPTLAQDAATKAYVDSTAGLYLPLAGGTMSGDLYMGSHVIYDVVEIDSPAGSGLYFYSDTLFEVDAPEALFSAIVALNTIKITNGPNSLSLQDNLGGAFGSVSKDGSDMKIEAVTDLKLSAATQIKAMTELSMESAKIVNVTDPTLAQDAATKNYVDAVNIVSLVAGENINFGDAVYVSNGTGSDISRVSGRVYRLNAKNDDRIEFFGFANSTSLSGASVLVQVSGKRSGFSGLSVGKSVFASVAVLGNEGAVQTSSPTAANQWVIPVGVSVSETELVINGAGSATAVKITSEIINNLYADVALVNSNTILTNANSIILASGGVSGITVTLPSPTAGKIFTIKKVDSSPGFINVVASSGNIDGVAAKVIASQYDSVTITSDGLNFYLI